MSVKDAPRPSSSELPILKALWRTSPLTAKEIHASIAESRGWSFSSTRKTLDRMVEKDFLSVSTKSGYLAFRPKAGKLSTLALLIRDFTDRILEFRKAPPIALFVDSDLLNEAELEELERLLEEQHDIKHGDN